ncbi:MAG TPA: hypothetical protein VH349_18640 [Ktedonobacterales bacterium]|jgi:hypothetical protein
MPQAKRPSDAQQARVERDHFPAYHFVLELSDHPDPGRPLVIGQSAKTKKTNAKTTRAPDIDLTGRIGYKSQVGIHQALVDIKQRTVQLGPKALGRTYVNGQLLEEGQHASLDDGAFLNLDDVQFVVHFVDMTGTGHPYFLQEIIDTPSPDWPYYAAHKVPQTPWNPEGYSLFERMFSPDVQKEIPVWMWYVATRERRRWGIRVREVIGYIEEADTVERQRSASGERARKGLRSERARLIFARLDQMAEDRRRAFVESASARAPVELHARVVCMLSRGSIMGGEIKPLYQDLDTKECFLVICQDPDGTYLEQPIDVSEDGYGFFLESTEAFATRKKDAAFQPPEPLPEPQGRSRWTITPQIIEQVRHKGEHPRRRREQVVHEALQYGQEHNLTLKEIAIVTSGQGAVAYPACSDPNLGEDRRLMAFPFFDKEEGGWSHRCISMERQRPPQNVHLLSLQEWLQGPVGTQESEAAPSATPG